MPPAPSPLKRTAWLIQALFLAPALALAIPERAVTQEAEGPLEPSLVGPQSGTLIVAGGGPLGREIWERFVQLAGGDAADIVVIPTAGTDESFPDDWDVLEALRDAGAKRVTLLHTRDRERADTPEFAAPLSGATGVWIPGGRQHRLVDAYLHTRVHAEISEVLARGGVVGGSSAGASIQASFLVRGDPESNQIVMSERYAEGFGFLDRAAVDQHLLTRNRAEDLWLILDLYPDLLGIGLDEGTALVIEGNRAEVIGVSQAILYDASSSEHRTRVLEAGGVFDLGRREPAEDSTGVSSVRAPALR
jgi:cyanophycinase